MRKRWLITGVMSAGFVFMAAQGVLADERMQNLTGDIARGSGTVSIHTDMAQGAGRVANKTTITEENVPEAGIGISAGAVTGTGTVTGIQGAGAGDNGVQGTGTENAGIQGVGAGNTGMQGDVATGAGVVTVPGIQQDAEPGQDEEQMQMMEPLQNTGAQQDGEMHVGMQPNIDLQTDIELQEAAAQQDTEPQPSTESPQDLGPQGELDIDRTIGKNFIKQPFIECIGRSRSQVEEILGTSGEIEETEDYAAAKFDFHITYELGNHEDVRIDYKNDIAVRIFGTNAELLNFEKDEYSLSEIDAILQVKHVTLEGNTHFWHLQDEPDVTMELLDNYAFINAY